MDLMFTLICGRPRSGKTTYSNAIFSIEVLHLDSYGYEGIIKIIKITKIQDIVVEGVYESASRRMNLLRNIYCDKKRCIFMDTPLETIKTRCNGKIIPTDFELPTLEEGWDEIVIIRPGGEEVIKKNVDNSII